jgi:hypothetical protein
VIRPGSSRTRLWTRSGGAAVVLAASLSLTPLLGACGSQPGAAAVVGDRRITVGELQTATAELRTIVGDPSQVNQELVLGWLIAHPYVERVAAEHGQGVSPQDAEALFTRAKFTNAQGGRTPSEASIEAVQTAYALNLLTGQQSSTPESAKQATDEVLADLNAAHVEVNPRYGRFDYAWDDQTQSFTLSPRSPNWLQPTQPAQPASPSPSPSPSSS